MNSKIKILLSFSYVFFLMTVMLAVSACSDSFTDERDGQSYDIVQIGDQIWLAENLNFSGIVDVDAVSNGAANPNVDEANPNVSATLATFCPDGDNRNCKKYGRLYTWEAAQKSCPEGWRLPSKDDFEKLLKFVGGQKSEPQMTSSEVWTAAGAALKSTSGWFKKGNGTDAVHFNALPAGYKGDKFDGIGGYAYFWASTTDADEPAFAHYLFLDFSSPVAEIKSFDKNSARSVRCIKK